jgi:hypothetical protein
MAKKKSKAEIVTNRGPYKDVLASMVDLLESARRASARAVNCVMTATYWEIGRRIVEFEQGGEERAGYGEEMLKQLASDLTARFGRGFTWSNLYRMRRFYLAYSEILATLSPEFRDDSETSEERKLATVSPKLQTTPNKDLTTIQAIANCFPLPWSHYVKMLALDDENARRFYEEEALRGGWSVRQLNRQINSQFYQGQKAGEENTKEKFNAKEIINRKR